MNRSQSLAAMFIAVTMAACENERQLSDVDSGQASADSGDIIVDVGFPSVDIGTPTEDLGTPTLDTGSLPRDTGNPVQDAGVALRDTGNASTDVQRACSAQFSEPCPVGNECCGSSSTCLNDSQVSSRYCTRSCVVDCDCPTGWSCIGTQQGGRVCGRGRTNTCGSSCSLPESAQCQPGSTTACCAEGRTCGQLDELAPHPNGCCRTQGACSLVDGCCRGYSCLFGFCVPPSWGSCDPISASASGCPRDYPKCLPYSDSGGGLSCFRSTGNLPLGAACSQPTDCAMGSSCGNGICRRLCRTSNPQCPSGQSCFPYPPYPAVGVCG